MPIRNIKQWETNIIKNIEVTQSKNDRNIEFIFVYSEKMDESVKELKEKVKNKNNIYFLKDDKTGIYSAMNCGISKAKGLYLQFMGADDIYNEKGFNQVIAFIKQKNKPSIILCEAVLSTDKVKKNSEGNKLACGRGGRIHWLLSSPRIHQAMLYKNSIIKKNNLRYQTNLKVTSDYIFTAELLSRNNDVQILNICFVNYFKYGFSSNYSILSNYIEHIKGFANSRILRNYLLLVIFLRFILLIYKFLKYTIKFSLISIRRIKI